MLVKVVLTVAISLAQNSANGLRIGVCVGEKAKERTFDSPKSWGLDVASGCRVNGGACGEWAGMRPAAVGDVLGKPQAILLVILVGWLFAFGCSLL